MWLAKPLLILAIFPPVLAGPERSWECQAGHVTLELVWPNARTSQTAQLLPAQLFLLCIFRTAHLPYSAFFPRVAGACGPNPASLGHWHPCHQGEGCPGPRGSVSSRPWFQTSWGPPGLWQGPDCSSGVMCSPCLVSPSEVQLRWCHRNALVQGRAASCASQGATGQHSPSGPSPAIYRVTPVPGPLAVSGLLQGGLTCPSLLSACQEWQR